MSASSVPARGAAARPGPASVVAVDSLGPVEVPATALYGARTARAVRHLSVSGRTLADLPRLVEALAAVKVAAAQANRRAGVLPDAMASAIGDAAAGLPRLAADDPAQLPTDPLGGGGWIGVHQNVNEVVATVAASLLGRFVDPIAHVAASQSTADVCHTASRLALLAALDEARLALAAACAAWDDLARRSGDTATLARTCLQDASEVPASLLPAGAATAIGRALDRLATAAAPLASVTLGATVVGTGDGACEAYRVQVVDDLATATGRRLTRHPSPASALQHGDDLVALADAVAGAAATLARGARDVRWLGAGPTGGAAELRIEPVMEGSAYFDGKSNPVVAETVILGALQIEALTGAVRLAAGASELHLHVFENLGVVNLLDSLDLLTRTAHRAAELAAATSVDTDRCAQLAAGARRPRPSPHTPGDD